MTETMVEVDRQKLLWASQIRELMVNLRQMSDIKPNLVAGIYIFDFKKVICDYRNDMFLKFASIAVHYGLTKF